MFSGKFIISFGCFVTCSSYVGGFVFFSHPLVSSGLPDSNNERQVCFFRGVLTILTSTFIGFSQTSLNVPNPQPEERPCRFATDKKNLLCLFGRGAELHMLHWQLTQAQKHNNTEYWFAKNRKDGHSLQIAFKITFWPESTMTQCNGQSVLLTT